MKRLLLLTLLLVGCASEPKKGFDLPPAVREVFRGGELKGLENATNSDLGIPDQYDQVSHVCVSAPIYNLDGSYFRTAVRCW